MCNKPPYLVKRISFFVQDPRDVRGTRDWQESSTLSPACLAIRARPAHNLRATRDERRMTPTWMN